MAAVQRRWCQVAPGLCAAAVAFAPVPLLAQDAEPGRPALPDQAPDEQPAPQRIDSAQLDRLLEQLIAKEPQARFEATARLATQADIHLRDIETLLKRDNLVPEQRQRLFSIAQARFYSGPRAGLGFRTQDTTGEHGVTIQNVVAGFPASTILKVGDRIMAVDGKPLANFTAIRPLIVSRDPGDVLDLTIIRNGETIKVKAPLGYYNRLDDPRMDQAVLAEAWEVRSHGLRNETPPPIASGLQPADWSADHADSFVRVIEVGPREAAAAEGESGVVMGGEPRGGTNAADSQWQEGGIQLHPGFARPAQNLGLEHIEQQRRAQLLIRETIDSQLAMPDLAADRRRVLEQQRATIQNEIRRLEQLVEQLRLDDQRRGR